MHFIINTFDINCVESELERLFAENLLKYLSDDALLTTQVNVNTICGNFRLDFVVLSNDKKYAFECDGQEFHNESRDEWRDAMILGAGAVDFIYRLRGPDLYYHTEDCLYIISKWNPSTFSHRGIINLTTLASKEARHWHDCNYDNTIARISYLDESNTLSPLKIRVERRCKKNPIGQKIFWKTLFAYATEHGGGNLDMLIQQYRNE